MKKIEVQQRVLQNGRPLDLDKFEWDEKTKTFSSKENGLVLDFSGISYCTFTTGSDCTFNTGSDCTFTTGSGCVIVNRNIFEVIQPEAGDIIQICPCWVAGHLVNGKLNGVPHIIADGILSKIVSKKGNVYKVINCGKNIQSYLIERQDGDKKVYSHGKTLREARDSLLYKISDRDTSAYENMTLDTVLTREECIIMYRAITGACESGTKYFVESQDKVKKKYKISEIIGATKGQFGNELLTKFFNKNG